MYCLEDLKYNKLYKKQFLLPFNKEDKRHGSAILLLTPSWQESKYLISQNPFTIDRAKTFMSYYIEKDITYTINQESRALECTYPEDGILLESGDTSPFTETTDIKIYDSLEEDSINELACKLHNKVIFFNEMDDDEIFYEAFGNNNGKYKRLLYNNRIRNNKTMFSLYDTVKSEIPSIRKCFVNYKRYNGFNLWVDLYYYNKAYLENNNFNILKSNDMYFEFIRRIIMDKRITQAGYKKKTVFVPVFGWNETAGTNLFDFRKNLNPISVLFKRIRFDQAAIKRAFEDTTFVFFGYNGYFKFSANEMDSQTYIKFMRFINKLKNNEVIDDSDEPEENSSGAIAADIIATVEKNKGVSIHNLTGDAAPNTTAKEADKALLVKKVNDASKFAKDVDDAISKLENDKDVKRILSDLEDDADEGVKLSGARQNRINNANDSFMNKQLNGKSVKEMITESNKPKELQETSLPIQTINDDWHHLKATNFEKEYDLDADIVKILASLSNKDKRYPLVVLDISTEDTSTSEDSIITYTVKFEDSKGKRFSIKFDIPKFRNNRFMRLKGNEKIFSIEMPLIPISKTSDSRTQIVTFYNKLFVDRYNTSKGKSNPFSDRLIKALAKYKGSNIKVITGDNSRICTKYALPIDYIDLASAYSKIIYNTEAHGEITIYFNQDEIRKIPGVNPKNGIPIAMSSKGKVLYYNAQNGATISQFIANTIMDNDFRKIYDKQSMLKRATYSRVWILNTYIPTIVILAHDMGLVPAMDLAGIKYDISEDKSLDFNYDSIKLKDGYINFVNTYDSMMLMNGLKDCDTESISISDLNKKTTWINELSNFGGRNKSDGLDNFAELMYDPITVEVSKDFKLPTTYHEALIYASNMLVDNKYTKHTDLSTNRYRTNEVIAAQFYRVITDAYRQYAGNMRRGRSLPMTMKQSAVIDLIMQQNTTSDLSVFQPLLEYETKNTISTKGVTGLNSDRAYTLDKRSYDESMVNIIAQSTGFASTVGVNRQTTIDPGITGGRGYFKQTDISQGSVTKSLCMAEALMPFTTSSNDPFRVDMGFVQTAKHGTPIEKSLPELITTGAQEALPYLSSDMFAFKAKYSGVVTEITDQYMLVDYDDGKKDYINLDEQTMKNSDGGFYITLQLKTDKKVGDKFKTGEILAWDKKSFSKTIGQRQLSYNTGALCKVAVMSTEDGFEDSGTCSEWLSETMGSDIVLMKPIVLPCSTNILSICKKGQKIREGEPLLIFQNAFDDEDANLLLKNLSVDDGDITTIGRSVVKSKVTGEITDIKIYRTCEIKDMSESLQKIVKGREREVQKLKSIAAVAESDVQFDSVGKMDATGKMKNAENSVLIEFYMKYHDRMGAGDKCLAEVSNKNIIMQIYPDSDAPYTDFRPDEAIDDITSASSLDGRIITSPIKTGALNKALIELQRQCAEIYGEKWLNIHEIYDYYYGK